MNIKLIIAKTLINDNPVLKLNIHILLIYYIYILQNKQAYHKEFLV